MEDILLNKNILKHNLVPEHIILNDEETEEVLNKFNITVDDLPKILTSDQVVKAIGAKEGDVLKIIRKSETAGVFEAYRVVKN